MLWHMPLKKSFSTRVPLEIGKFPGRTGGVAIFGREGRQILAPAVWRSLIECRDQSSLNSLEFTFLAENLELSVFDFFNGICQQRKLASEEIRSVSRVVPLIKFW